MGSPNDELFLGCETRLKWISSNVCQPARNIVDWYNFTRQVGEQTGIDLNVTSLDDLTVSLTQGTQQTSQDLPVVNDEEVVEVQGIEVDARRSAKKGLSYRSKKFDQDEDETICSAWLNTSKDPIHGTNQKGTKFWGRIKEYFDGQKKSRMDSHRRICTETVCGDVGNSDGTATATRDATTKDSRIKIDGSTKLENAESKMPNTWRWTYFSFGKRFRDLANSNKWQISIA